jgi:hypothetical protein
MPVMNNVARRPGVRPRTPPRAPSGSILIDSSWKVVWIRPTG